MATKSFKEKELLIDLIHRERATKRCGIVRMLQIEKVELLTPGRLEIESLEAQIGEIREKQHEKLAEARLESFGSDTCGIDLHESLMSFDKSTFEIKKAILEG